MTQFDDDEVTETPTVTAGLGDSDRVGASRRGGGRAGLRSPVRALFRARTSWYFAIFAQREAEAAVEEVLTDLFGSLTAPSNLSLAERAYRLARATALRHAVVPAKAEIAKNRAATTLALQVDS